MAPKAGRGRKQGAKRLQPERETEPATKRQKLEEEQSLDIIDIDPDGDLIIIFESHKTGYNVDSNAVRRASPVLYEQCLAVRPADGSESNWTFKAVPKISREPASAVLNLIHGNMHRVPQSMHFQTLHQTFTFAIEYEMFDRYYNSLKQWYDAMAPSKAPKMRNCCRLWLAHKLNLKDKSMNLQKWAIFNLCDNGKGGLGHPSEEFPQGKPLDLSELPLSDKVITDRIIRLRSEAVNLILTKLREVQVSMISTTADGPLCEDFKGSGCEECLDRWFACLSRGLLQPRSVARHLEEGFPSLFPVIEADKYQRTLEELCNFVGSLQDALDGYLPEISSSTCRSREVQEEGWHCHPPQLIGWVEVERLITTGLETPPDAI